MDMSRFHAAFFEESREGLDVMESGLLGMEVHGSPGDDWRKDLAAPHDTLRMPRDPAARPADWPDPARPQQFHLDVRVADVDHHDANAGRLSPPRRLDPPRCVNEQTTLPAARCRPELDDLHTFAQELVEQPVGFVIR